MLSGSCTIAPYTFATLVWLEKNTDFYWSEKFLSAENISSQKSTLFPFKFFSVACFSEPSISGWGLHHFVLNKQPYANIRSVKSMLNCVLKLELYIHTHATLIYYSNKIQLVTHISVHTMACNSPNASVLFTKIFTKKCIQHPYFQF